MNSLLHAHVKHTQCKTKANNIFASILSYNAMAKHKISVTESFHYSNF